MALAPLFGRIGLGLAALALAGGAGAWTIAGSGAGGALAMPAAAAVLALAVALVLRRSSMVTLAAVLLGVVHVLSRVGDDMAVLSTVAFSVAVFMVLELTWWSIDLHPAVAWERAANRRRALEILALAGGGAALAGAAGVTAIAGSSAGEAVFAAGLIAAPAVVWFGVTASRAATRRGKITS